MRDPASLANPAVASAPSRILNGPNWSHEAFRSVSLAAMTLMLAAQVQGLVTGPMRGFDPAAVSREFALAVDELPVILVTVGYPAEGNWAQKPRRATHDVLQVI